MGRSVSKREAAPDQPQTDDLRLRWALWSCVVMVAGPGGLPLSTACRPTSAFSRRACDALSGLPLAIEVFRYLPSRLIGHSGGNLGCSASALQQMLEVVSHEFCLHRSSILRCTAPPQRVQIAQILLQPRLREL